MSSLVYPANLPGLTFGSTRSPVFNTGLQQALSSKESAIAYQQYPMMEFELQYEFLRDDITPSQFQALVGLFMAVGGKYDSFLYVDPVFNTVVNMQFGVTDGTTLTYQTTATYQNVGGPGGAEIIQNFNGVPFYGIQRYGTLIEYPDTGGTRTNYLLHSQTFTAPWNPANVTLGGTGFLAPDGSATVVALVDNTTSNVQHSISTNVGGTGASGVYTFSVFVISSATPSSAECDYVWIQLQDSVVTSSVVTVVFNVRTGVVVSSNITGASWSGAVNEVGKTSQTNNWYRISVAITKATANTISVFISPSQSSGSVTYAGANGATSAYVWGAQLENNGAVPPSGGVFPTMYIPTAAAVVTQQDILGIGATGIININSANFGAIAGIKLLWTGSFFYRVRFDDDSMTSTQFMNNLWENKKVKLRQRKL